MQPRPRPKVGRRAIGAVVAVAATLALGLAPAWAQDDEAITIPLNEYDDSGVTGEATLRDTDAGLAVAMQIGGEAVTGNHPTHIHTGTCADFDPDPTYPLTTVILDKVSEEGRSDSTVEGVRLDDLLRDDYVILVHKSSQELTTYFVCGDIKMSESVVSSPRSGVGAPGASGPVGAVALGLLAALAAAGAGVARRRAYGGS